MREKGAPPSADTGSDCGTVIVGTYDGGLVGLHAGTGEQTFGYAPHAGCVKALACSGAGRCASGGTDHMVRLFDLAKGKELGELQEHDDTVCCIEFWGNSNLITGGVDGLACIWRCSDFEMLLKFRAHKTAISSLAVHESGKLMASAARDSSIRLWDLMRGTSAANVPVDELVESLMWSPSGNRLCALSAGRLTVVDVTLGGAVAVFRDPGAGGLMRITFSAATFLRDSDLLVGDGKGELRILEFQAAKDAEPALVEASRLPADQQRVRVKAVSCNRSGGKEDSEALAFAVGTSSGRVEIWQFKARKGTPQPGWFNRLHVVEAGVRLTCMTFWSGMAAMKAQTLSPLATAMEELEDMKAAEEDMRQADSALRPAKKKRKRKEV